MSGIESVITRWLSLWHSSFFRNFSSSTELVFLLWVGQCCRRFWQLFPFLCVFWHWHSMPLILTKPVCYFDRYFSVTENDPPCIHSFIHSFLPLSLSCGDIVLPFKTCPNEGKEKLLVCFSVLLVKAAGIWRLLMSTWVNAVPPSLSQASPPWPAFHSITLCSFSLLTLLLLITFVSIWSRMSSLILAIDWAPSMVLRMRNQGKRILLLPNCIEGRNV